MGFMTASVRLLGGARRTVGGSTVWGRRRAPRRTACKTAQRIARRNPPAFDLVPQVVAGHEQLVQVAGRLSEPRRDRATARVSPAQSRPTVSTTMSGMLPVLSP